MNNLSQDQLDKIIGKVVKEEIDKIDLADIDMKYEWYKLKKRLDAKQEGIKIHKHKKRKKQRMLKIAMVLVGAIFVFALLDIGIGGRTMAWRDSIIQTMINKVGNSTIINRESSAGLNDNNSSIDISDKMEVSIEEARDIVPFQFKELPYHLQEVIVTQLSHNDYVIDMTYSTEHGQIHFKQMEEGLQFSSTIEVPKDSTVEEFIVDDVEYIFINIHEKISYLEWSSYGVNHTLNFTYSITKEEAIELIKSMG